MKRTAFILLVYSLAAMTWAQSPPTASLRGVVTDPSGAVVPGVQVELRGRVGEQRTTSGPDGQYVFRSLPLGRYVVRAVAKGFKVEQRQDFDISGASTLDFQLVIAAERQVVNVEDESKDSINSVSSAGTTVIRERELGALTDDPDQLAQQLQALAGPGAGPNGGQIYVDGFASNRPPPKASIREIQISSNPISAEYDRPSSGDIRISTKPGSNLLKGQASLQFNNQNLNSRSPLLATSLPPYRQFIYYATVGGPIKKDKASFSINLDGSNINENAFILATTLDSNLNLQTVNQAIVTPQARYNTTVRTDYTINANNTLLLRYVNGRKRLQGQGVGGYNLASQAFNFLNTENTIQIAETVVLGAKAINETRFQFSRNNAANTANNASAAIVVSDAFMGGAPQIGNSGTLRKGLEIQNLTTVIFGANTIKWGLRARESFLDDTSLNNFGGTFTFFGGFGPLLDASSRPIPGTSTSLTALERYRRTLFLQRLGLPASLIQQYGGGASQFSLNAGKPRVRVNQFDIGLFANNDQRVRPNLTLSYGIRYEAQTNIRDFSNFAPRFGLAWGVDGRPNAPAKTVLRAGFGIFYDRVADSYTLNARRYDGHTQQSYLITDPPFFPAIPSIGSLAGTEQPQILQPLDSAARSPRTYQAIIGADRQLRQNVRLSVNYIETRGVGLLRSRNINAPINNSFPFGSPEIRLLTETSGFSRSHQLFVMPNVFLKKLFFFGYYGLSFGKDDNEGMPADPYNLLAEWGPATFADVRHRFATATQVSLPMGFSVFPFIVGASASPYNITTGGDPNRTGFPTQRPSLVTGLTPAACNGGVLVYAPTLGCFNLDPAFGTPTIGRNLGRGPASVTLNLKVDKTWSFFREEQGGVTNGASPGKSSRKQYDLTLGATAMNILNHPNFAPPAGNLASPYFGQYRALADPFGGSGSYTYNRKIEFMLRFSF